MAVVDAEDESNREFWREERVRPWWGNPLIWLGIGLLFVLLGIFVGPKLFGGVVLFLPFFWIRPRGRRPRPSH